MNEYPAFSLLSDWPLTKQQAFIKALPHLSLVDGEVVFERDDPTQDAYFIISGAVKSVNYSPDGKLAYFRLRKAGDCFGYYSAISEQPRTATMIAVGPTVVARIAGADFFTMVVQTPDIGRKFIKLIVGLLRIETKRLVALTTMTTHQRVAAELLARQTMSDDPYTDLPDRVEFASYLGMSRETLSRALNDLVKKKLIDIQGDQIYVLDQVGMEKLLGTN